MKSFFHVSGRVLLVGSLVSLPKAFAQHTADEHHEHEEHAAQVVNIDAATLKEFGIRLASVGPGELHEEVVLPGEIRYNREAFAYATPRYAGIVRSIEARLGEPVREGQVLATLESNETLRTFDVTAPFDGTVVSYDLALGESVAAGSALFAVADLSTVWADLRIYQRNLAQVRQGQRVLIEAMSGLEPFVGRISYIAPTIDAHTRTGLARVVLENPDRRWKPGLFIKGTISMYPHPAPLVVPRSALLRMDGEDVVFVQTEDGLEPRVVVVGHSDRTATAIEAGLEPGEVIAVENALSLKAELGKGSFGGHHHH